MDEKIKKLVEWMGWEWIDSLHIKDRNGCYVFDGTIFNPLINIQDAWMLVEKLASEDIEVEIGNNYVGGDWYCAIGTILEDAPTAPEAICAAILKLMEGE